MNYNLSYIIATYNRLPFLKITLEKLISELQTDEEIIVFDGNSTDGSKEYLNELFIQKKIHQFISEPDKNQAHAWNKAMLLARGCIIKKIIDDDVFCYKAIRDCKQYMLQNPEIEILISNDLSSPLNDPENIKIHTRLPQFEKWRKGIVPSFTFGDVHMLVSRSALAHIGVYNTSYVMMDWEYSLRISYLKATICFYTGYNALSVAHPQTVSALKNAKMIHKQGERAELFYEYAGDRADVSLFSKIKIWLGKTYYGTVKTKAKIIAKEISITELQAIYDGYYRYLEHINSSSDKRFIH